MAASVMGSLWNGFITLYIHAVECSNDVFKTQIIKAKGQYAFACIVNHLSYFSISLELVGSARNIYELHCIIFDF